MNPFKRPLFQAIFWLMVWLAFFLPCGNGLNRLLEHSPIWILQVALILGITYYAIPNFFKKKKYSPFLVFSVLTIILSIGLAHLLMRLTQEPPHLVLERLGPNQPPPFVFGSFTFGLTFLVTYFLTLFMEGLPILSPEILNPPQQLVEQKTVIQSPESAKDTLIIKSGYDLYKLKYEEILYVESSSEYVVFHTVTEKIMSHQRLKAVEKTLPSPTFLRVHRSYIVNTKLVSALKGKHLFIGEIQIPVSNLYMEVVKEKLFNPEAG